MLGRVSYAPPQKLPLKQPPQKPPPKKPDVDPLASLNPFAPKVEPPKPKSPTLEEIRAQQLAAQQLAAQQAAQQAAALAAQQKKAQELQAAKQLMARHFDVDDAHANNAARRGNQVTQAEFTQYAEKLASIQRGETSIKFEGGDNPSDAQRAHKTATVSEMATMMSTNTGRTLLGNLSSAARTTTLAPVPAVEQNATTRLDGLMAHVFGSDSRVKTAAGIDIGVDKRMAPVHSTSDTILLHELIHAYHNATGTRAGGNLAATDPGLGLGHKDIGVTKEEYATVGLGANAGDALTENAYRAERRAMVQGDDEKAKYDPRVSYRF